MADHFASDCGFLSPRGTDDITGLSVVRCDWDHEHQKWAFLLTSFFLIQHEMILMWVCHKYTQSLCEERNGCLLSVSTLCLQHVGEFLILYTLNQQAFMYLFSLDN